MSFTPRFETITDSNIPQLILTAARIINLPHEPKAVTSTRHSIQTVREAYTYPSDRDSIVGHLVRGVHSNVAWWLSDEESGNYRRSPVMINDQEIDWINVQSSMSDLHPFKLRCDIPALLIEDLINWYTRFQEIHPFIDGNGRVGGIIVAGISLAILEDRILVPLH